MTCRVLFAELLKQKERSAKPSQATPTTTTSCSSCTTGPTADTIPEVQRSSLPNQPHNSPATNNVSTLPGQALSTPVSASHFQTPQTQLPPYVCNNVDSSEQTVYHTPPVQQQTVVLSQSTSNNITASMVDLTGPERHHDSSAATIHHRKNPQKQLDDQVASVVWAVNTPAPSSYPQDASRITGGQHNGTQPGGQQSILRSMYHDQYQQRPDAQVQNQCSNVSLVSHFSHQIEAVPSVANQAVVICPAKPVQSHTGGQFNSYNVQNSLRPSMYPPSGGFERSNPQNLVRNGNDGKWHSVAMPFPVSQPHMGSYENPQLPLPELIRPASRQVIPQGPATTWLSHLPPPPKLIRGQPMRPSAPSTFPGGTARLQPGPSSAPVGHNGGAPSYPGMYYQQGHWNNRV